MAQQSSRPLVALFGYDSSLYTQKVQHVLRFKRIPHTFVTVPSMMPRPILKDNLNVTYRKIPVLAINREIYIDTSIICEALEQYFPSSSGFPSIYPRTATGATNRSLIRGMASYWTDRPVFRATCGLMPTAVWRSDFGTDRSQLIGHKLDPEKLRRKMPEKLSEVDMQCSMFETMLEDTSEQRPWIFDTETPSMADIAWYVQLDWGLKNSHGAYIANLTAGAADGEGDLTMDPVFNKERYPKMLRWYHNVQAYFTHQAFTETKINGGDEQKLNEFLQQMTDLPNLPGIPLLQTPAPPFDQLDARSGLVKGASVAITPDDTGRGDPTLGTFIAASPEEIVISPEPINGKGPAVGDVRLHFPRLGFVIRHLAAQGEKVKL